MSILRKQNLRIIRQNEIIYFSNKNKCFNPLKSVKHFLEIINIFISDIKKHKYV